MFVCVQDRGDLPVTHRKQTKSKGESKVIQFIASFNTVYLKAFS